MSSVANRVMSTSCNIIMCGSFSPITFAHLHAMEIARDCLKDRGINVQKGYLSPVSDGYAKKDLAPANHRAAMIAAAVETSDWLELSSWEIEQPGFTLTLKALQEIKKITDDSIPLYLVGGADLVASMNIPNVWHDEDVRRKLKTWKNNIHNN